MVRRGFERSTRREKNRQLLEGTILEKQRLRISTPTQGDGRYILPQPREWTVNVAAWNREAGARQGKRTSSLFPREMAEPEQGPNDLAAMMTGKLNGWGSKKEG